MRLYLLPFLLALLTVLTAVTPRVTGSGLVVIAAVVLVALWPWRHQFRWRAQAPAWLAFLAFAVSAFFSDSPRAPEMLRDAALVMGAGSILFASLPAWPPVLLDRTLRWFASAFLFAFIYHAGQYALDFPLDRIFGHKDALYDMLNSNIPKRSDAILLLLAWPAALVLAALNYRRQALALLVVVMLGQVAFISRSALLAGLIGLAVLLLALAAPRLVRRARMIALTFAIPLTLVMLTCLPLLEHWLWAYLPHSGQARLDIWQTALAEAARAWPRGVGLDGSRVFTPAIPIHPHNIFLQIYLESGAWGTGLVTLLLALLARRIAQVETALQPYLWGAVASGLVMLSLAYGLWQGWWLGAFALAGLMLTACVRARPAAPPAA